MALTRYKLGELIELVDERNTFGLSNFSGLNISKEFMPTAASTDNLDSSKYKVVREKRFVFSGMQTGRDKTIRISMHESNEPIIVSPAYTTFEICRSDVIVPEYFFMLFRSPEMDRYGWFLSDSSIRSNLDWPVFCDIELNLPPIEIQQKYVDIYNAMLANQKAYEHGIDDLQVAAEGVLEKFKKGTPRQPLGALIREIDERNADLAISGVNGVKKEKVFMPSVASGADLSKYKLVKPQQFACNLMHVGRDVAVPVAMNTGEQNIIVSPAYLVFEVNTDDLLPEFLLSWLSRSETDRYAWFMSDTNVRSGMEKKRFLEIDVPIPNKKAQEALAEISATLIERRTYAARLKEQLKALCPVLIKGSLDEAVREGVQS